jgi:hypothetical protein
MVKRMTVEQHLQRYAILPLLFVADSSEGRVCMSCASWLAGWLAAAGGGDTLSYYYNSVTLEKK